MCRRWIVAASCAIALSQLARLAVFLSLSHSRRRVHQNNKQAPSSTSFAREVRQESDRKIGHALFALVRYRPNLVVARRSLPHGLPASTVPSKPHKLQLQLANTSTQTSIWFHVFICSYPKTQTSNQTLKQHNRSKSLGSSCCFQFRKTWRENSNLRASD